MEKRKMTPLEAILKIANEGDAKANAYLFLSNGHYKDALACFNAIIKEALSKPNHKLEAAWAYDDLASCHLLQYQLVEALHDYENALELRKIALPEGIVETRRTEQDINSIKTMMRFCELLTLPMRDFDGAL